MPGLRPPGEFIIGWDLDDTLVNTRRSILTALARTSRTRGVRFKFDPEQARSRLGIPIQEELALHLPPRKVPRATDVFRGYLRQLGAEGTTLLPGAPEAIACVHDAGGFNLVLTTKHTPMAVELLERLDLRVDGVMGDMRGNGKRDALLEIGALAYIGDHVNDIRAAIGAGVTAVGVATGNYRTEELAAARANFTLETLERFPPLLEHLIRWDGRAENQGG